MRKPRRPSWAGPWCWPAVGQRGHAELPAKVVDVVDVESGTVRLRQQVEDADEMAVDTRSTKTVRARK
jgi:hypothetical protein